MASEAPSLSETELDQDEPMASPMGTTKPVKATKGKKGRSKKTTNKSKEKDTRVKQPESQITASFAEPEDDDFEVKVDEKLAPTTRTKKRKSEDMTGIDEDRGLIKANIEDPATLKPAKRQRRTRASSNVVQPQIAPSSVIDHEIGADAHMTDAEEMPPPPAPAMKKKGKGGKKRATSSARKTSNASIASEAPLRADVPDDVDIDAALEAQLDRPLTDEEGDATPLEVEQSKTRRLTRTKPGSKKATASVAHTRRGTSASSVNANIHSSTPSAPIEVHDKENGLASLGDRANEEADSSSKEQGTQLKAARKVTRPQQEKADNAEPTEQVPSLEEVVKADRIDVEPKAHEDKGSEDTKQSAARVTPVSDVPYSMPMVDSASGINSLTGKDQTLHDDSGHETDGSVLKQSRSKRGGKKAPVATKKAKGGRKAGPKGQKTEEVEHESVVNAASSMEVKQTRNEASDHTSTAVPDGLPAEPSKDQDQDTKVAKPIKAKGRPGRPKATEKKPPMASSLDVPDTVVATDDKAATQPSPSARSTPQRALSSQSSDAENQPPSSRPSVRRPPLALSSPSKSQITKVPLAVTPTMTNSRLPLSKLHSSFPWTAVDLEHIFSDTPSANKENDPFVLDNDNKEGTGILTSPEKKLTVEEWIHFNAQRGEERLRNESERVVGKFEAEGVRALKTLEGIVCVQ